MAKTFKYACPTYFRLYVTIIWLPYWGHWKLLLSWCVTDVPAAQYFTISTEIVQILFVQNCWTCSFSLLCNIHWFNVKGVHLNWPKLLNTLVLRIAAFMSLLRSLEAFIFLVCYRCAFCSIFHNIHWDCPDSLRSTAYYDTATCSYMGITEIKFLWAFLMLKLQFCRLNAMLNPTFTSRTPKHDTHVN